MRIEIQGTVLGLAVAAGMLAATFSLAEVLQSTNRVDSRHGLQPNGSTTPTAVHLGEEAQRGYKLFEQNCAHCHGDDARGDEGPSLYNVRKSDARIATLVKGGVKGEMPSFVKKFNDTDIQALIAYLRTLKN